MIVDLTMQFNQLEFVEPMVTIRKRGSLEEKKNRQTKSQKFYRNRPCQNVCGHMKINKVMGIYLGHILQ